MMHFDEQDLNGKTPEEEIYKLKKAVRALTEFINYTVDQVEKKLEEGNGDQNNDWR